MKSSLFLTAIASASLLAGCGGGGDDGGSTATSTIALSGIAAKGLMANADVAVYAVNTDGQAAGNPLATTTTDGNGRYQLNFSATKGQPVVIKVSAKADGTTTHLDEVSGLRQGLPAGFSMRALLVPQTTGAISTSINVTPFSEMTVAAAARANGGITLTNAAQATSTVTQLLGFDPTTVTVTSAQNASATLEQQKLAVMLAAVSQMSSNGDLGCNSSNAGANTACVVGKLSANSSLASLQLGNGVSSALQSATQTVLNKPELVGAIQTSTLVNIVTNLGCSGAACTPAASGGGTPAPDPVAAAITAAKLLFTQIRTDLTTMFSPGGASANAQGALNQEAFKFEQVMKGVQPPVETLLKDAGAIVMGVDLYHDYKAGRTSLTDRARAFDMTATNNTVRVPAAACTLYQDADTQIRATAPANANYIGCGARFYATRSYSGTGYVHTEWRHGITLTPQTDGSFAYSTRARQRVQSCDFSNNCTLTSNKALQLQSDGSTPLAAFTGNLTPVLTGSHGNIASFTLKGELPAAFKSGGTTLVNFKHQLDIRGSQTLVNNEPTALALSGYVAAYKDATTQEGKLTLNNGNIDKPSGAAANLVWNTGAAEFEGDLKLQGMTTDKSGTNTAPTQLALKGMLRNIANGVSTEFLSGQLNVSATGYDQFDSTQPPSATNKYSGNLSFVGAVTAPNRPRLELTLGTGTVVDGRSARQPATLQYRTWVNGLPRSVVTLTATPGSQPGTADSFRLAEASSGLSMSWLDGASTIDLVFGSPAVKIGQFKDGLLTFSDNSVISLDLGL